MGYIRRNHLSALIAGLIVVGVAKLASAHPVTYAGGGLVDVMYGHDRIQIDTTYSPRSDLGVSSVYARLKDRRHDAIELGLLRGSWLAERWNMWDSQANLYLWSGVGKHNDEGAAGLVGAQADWETRRYYALAKVDHFMLEERGEFLFGALRGGVAPYPIEFDQVNLFLIGQLDYAQQGSERWSFAPIVRVFYEDYLLEMGVSTAGDSMLNVMYHFYLN